MNEYIQPEYMTMYKRLVIGYEKTHAEAEKIVRKAMREDERRAKIMAQQIMSEQYEVAA